MKMVETAEQLIQKATTGSRAAAAAQLESIEGDLAEKKAAEARPGTRSAGVAAKAAEMAAEAPN